ncbi:hypothetical protein HRI_001675700 [Hibiscus trionum]|uniref:Endonuclease/exonuclease/phosphatase domain-containing protein n=1 Tax=Hibiscus trionum TaxID=183268 RepID=A0A9W7HMD5_HIBTR|nr:hypothetical protein HRI_001675700 [Hibiscus trionum]
MDWKFISLNIIGLGRAEKARAVRLLRNRKKPQMMFLQETKVTEFSNVLLRRLGVIQNQKIAFSPSVGSAGGILSVWDTNFFSVVEIYTLRNFVAVLGNIQNYEKVVGFLNVYGPSTEAEKREFFRELSVFLGSHNATWCVGGDFNAFLFVEEKIGYSWNMASTNLFRTFIQNTQLADLHLNGEAFTWSNNKEPPTFIRLDRFLVSHDFLAKFPCLNQNILAKSISDHNPISLENDGVNWGAKPFKLYNYLMEEERFVDLVTTAMSKPNSRRTKQGLFGKLKGLKGDIKTWSLDKRGT